MKCDYCQQERPVDFGPIAWWDFPTSEIWAADYHLTTCPDCGRLTASQLVTHDQRWWVADDIHRSAQWRWDCGLDGPFLDRDDARMVAAIWRGRGALRPGSDAERVLIALHRRHQRFPTGPSKIQGPLSVVNIPERSKS